MKVSDFIVKTLIRLGITETFGYPGGNIAHILNSLDKYKDKIKSHLCYHEQAAALAACGYAQVAHKPCMVYATSGPGATNLITGIANAYFDSIPVLFIIGQVNSKEIKSLLLGGFCLGAAFVRQQPRHPTGRGGRSRGRVDRKKWRRERRSLWVWPRG